MGEIICLTDAFTYNQLLLFDISIICLQKRQKRKIDICQMTESQVTGLHKCDDCPQCLEFDQGQFLFVLTQFVSLWLVQTLPSWPPIGWRVTSVCPHCVTPGGAILNKIMTGLAWPGLVTLGFYLQFHSPHCLGHPAPGTRTSGDISTLDTHSFPLLLMMFGLLWWRVVIFDVCSACSSHLSVCSPCHIWFPQLTKVTCQPQPTIPVKSAILKQKRWQKRKGNRLFLQSSHCLFWRKVPL